MIWHYNNISIFHKRAKSHLETTIEALKNSETPQLNKFFH